MEWTEQSVEKSVLQSHTTYEEFLHALHNDPAEEIIVEQWLRKEWLSVNSVIWEVIKPEWMKRTSDTIPIRWKIVPLTEPNIQAIVEKVEKAPDILPSTKVVVAQITNTPVSLSMKAMMEESRYTPRLFWPSSTDPKGVLLQYGTQLGQVYLLPYSTKVISSSFRLLQNAKSKIIFTSDPLVNNIQCILLPVVPPISSVIRTLQEKNPSSLSLLHELTKDHVAVLNIENGPSYLFSVDILLYIYMDFFKEESLSPIAPFFVIAKRALTTLNLMNASMKERGHSRTVLLYMYWCYVYWQEECLHQDFSLAWSKFQPESVEEVDRLPAFIRQHIVNFFYSNHRIVDDTLLSRFFSTFKPLRLPLEMNGEEKVFLKLEGVPLHWYMHWNETNQEMRLMRRDESIAFESNYLIKRLNAYFLLSDLFVTLKPLTPPSNVKVLLQHTRPPYEESEVRFGFHATENMLYMVQKNEKVVLIQSTSFRRPSFNPKVMVDAIGRNEFMELEQWVMRLEQEQKWQKERSERMEATLKENVETINRLNNGLYRQWEMFGYWKASMERDVHLLAERRQEREIQVATFQQRVEEWQQKNTENVVEPNVLAYLQQQSVALAKTIQEAETELEPSASSSVNEKVRSMASSMTFLLNQLSSVMWQNGELLKMATIGAVTNDPALYSVVMILGQMMEALTAMAKINVLVTKLISKNVLFPLLLSALRGLQKVREKIVYTISDVAETTKMPQPDWVELRYAIVSTISTMGEFTEKQTMVLGDAILYVPRKAVKKIQQLENDFLQRIPNFSEVLEAMPDVSFLNPMTSQTLSPSTSNMEKQIDAFALKTLSLINAKAWDIAKTIQTGTIEIVRGSVAVAKKGGEFLLGGLNAAVELAAWSTTNAFRYTPFLLANARDFAIFMHRVEEEDADEDMEGLSTWIPLFYNAIPSVADLLQSKIIIEKEEQVKEEHVWDAVQHAFSSFMSLVDMFQTFSVLIQTYFIAFKNTLPSMQSPKLPAGVLKKIMLQSRKR